MGWMREAGGRVTERATEAATRSFEDFFRAEHARLLRALFLVTGNEGEAEDLMQEAFLKMWERWDRVRHLDDPTGYLYRTAMNAFRSRYRRAARAARRVVGMARGADAFEAADERDLVARALATLTPRQRAALVLTEMVGYDSEEAGRALGVKAVTARVLASQARAALRQVLERSDD
ncbi:MAG: sigma-70 family RNA polymerase sigma factor [Actinomycetota bacterium]|nr:sigma-70 family RNA polymerase sigma factor [Actinomycetota bacterium]